MTFAALKRKLTVGTTLTMVSHDWFPNGPLIGIPRKIKTVQTNGIQFEPHQEGKQGSWLYWGKASEYTITEDCFTVWLGAAGDNNYMTYKFKG